MTARRACRRPAFVGIGSNLSGPSSQVEAAIDALDDVKSTRVVAVSGLYRSAAFGGVEQPDFVNAVAGILTGLEPLPLLRELQSIEDARGRDRGGQRWGPRVLDLDLLLYAGRRIEEPDLVVPHPGIGERNFVLLPLRELAPDLVIPGLGPIARLQVPDEPAISRVG